MDLAAWLLHGAMCHIRLHKGSSKKASRICRCIEPFVDYFVIGLLNAVAIIIPLCSTIAGGEIIQGMTAHR
jgi:hypothetical protein